MDCNFDDEYERLKKNPNDLFSDLYSRNDEERKQLILKLNREENIDICEYAIKAIEKGCNVWNVSLFLNDIISELELNNDSLFNYLKITCKLMQGDLLDNIPYIQIQNITNKQPAFAERFLDYLTLSEESFAIQYIVEIILHLVKFNIEEKHEKFIIMINSNIEHNIICGINGLGRIDYSYDLELLDKTLSCFDIHLIDEQQNIIRAIIFSLRLLYRFGDKIITRLVSLSERNDPSILSEILNFLYFEYDKIYNEIYFDQLFFSLIKLNCKYLGKNSHLDLLLYSIITKTKNVNLVINFIYKWMIESDCKPNKIDELQLLDCTFSGICSDVNIMQTTLFLLLNSDNIYAPRLASSLILSNGYYEFQNIGFNISSLLNANDIDIVFISRKILGYFINPKVILPLFLSLLVAKKKNEQIINFLKCCFIEYIGFNYPFTTIKYLEDVICDKKLDKTSKVLLNEILEIIKEISRARTEKIKLNEFKPSRKDIYLLYKEEWRQNQIINELADERSVLKLLSTKSYIKYGKAAFYHINGKTTESQPLKCFSYSMEEPYELHIDPVRLEEDSYNLKFAKRGE